MENLEMHNILNTLKIVISLPVSDSLRSGLKFYP